jgi:hypothetical protein
VNDFSFGNIDAKFDSVDRKAICAVACDTNEKTLSVFGQNFFDSAASRPAAISNGWRALQAAFWTHFCSCSEKHHFALVENEFRLLGFPK